MRSSLAAKVTLVLSASFLVTAVSLVIRITLLTRLQLAAPQHCKIMQPTPVSPPLAPRRPTAAADAADNGAQQPHGVAHQDINLKEHLSDPYTWLRDDARNNPEVRSYLQAENAYAGTYFKPLKGLVGDIKRDMHSIVAEVEVSSPSLHNGYIYFDKRGPGDDYWNTYRLPLLPPAAGSNAGQQNSLAAAVAAAMTQAQAGAITPGSNGSGSSGSNGGSSGELVLDQNSLSDGHVYWDVVAHVVSPDGRLVAYLFDTKGNEDFTLQVVDLASGCPLLSSGLPGCGETLLWWGDSSNTLVYSYTNHSGPGNGQTVLRLLKLEQQQQQQQQQQQHALVYVPVDGERGLELSLSTDRRFVILTSSVEGDTKVVALPTSTPLNFSSGSSGSSNGESSSNGSSSDLPLAVAAAAWWPLVSPDSGMDVLDCEHLGSSGSNGGSNAGSSSSSSSMFVALVDSDSAPDGEVMLIHAAAPGSSDAAHSAKPFMDVLVGNYSSTDDNSSSSSSGSSNGYASDDDSSSRASSSNNKQQQQQQQQQGERGEGELPPLEIRSFKLHPRGSHIAVGVRRGGVCAVDVYEMPLLAGSAAAVAAMPAGGEGETPHSLLTVTLRTGTSSSSSSSTGGANGGSSSGSSKSTAAAAAAAMAAASAAANSNISAAKLSWVLVLEEPTLVLDLVGVMTNDDVMRPGGTSHPGGDDSSDDAWLVVRVSGITSPTAVYYVNLRDPQQQVKVYEEQLVNFSPGAYTSRLEWATSADGVRVPLTLAYKSDLLKGDGSNPAILHAYGAYGSSQWPSFNPADIALLDRGMVLAICHVRGGGELGSRWHTSAKKLHKKQTFEDLLACADHLTASSSSGSNGGSSGGYSSSSKLGLWGRSAGGLTLGAAINMRPGVAAAAVLDVPFLDVLGDMSDPELPLTIKERGEWGDPLESQAVHDYIVSYSPLHNLDPQRAHDYPAMLLTASLYDTRVNFWEPAKYVSTLRHLQQQQQQQPEQKSPNNTNSPIDGSSTGPTNSSSSSSDSSSSQRPLLLMTDLQAGHFAASAASSRLEERATKVAFLLTNLGAC